TTADAYFLKGTVLTLFNCNGSTDSRQVLNRDSSYVYDACVWRGTIGGTASVDGVDAGSMVSQFLSAFPNPSTASGSTQSNIVQSMIDYFTKYDDWANSNFTDNTKKQAAITQQQTMMTLIYGIYSGQSGNNYPPQTPCP